MPPSSLWLRLIRCKPVADYYTRPEGEGAGERSLARSFGLFQLTMLGEGTQTYHEID